MIILQSLAIALAISLDAFAASFAYGSQKIIVPLKSVLTLNAISTLITAIALLLGKALEGYIPHSLTAGISFAILFILGIVNILDSVTKSIIRKHSQFNKEVKFSLFNFRFILTLYANPEKADVDKSKILSPVEAVSVGVALSLDGVAVGFGAALAGHNVWIIIIGSVILGISAVISGSHLGNKIANKTTINLSWLGGCILIIMAFSKLL